jgi:Uma2 family endonuclease
MSIGPSHAAIVDSLNRILIRRLDERLIVRCQGPIRLNRQTEPQPDISVLRASPDGYSSAHPQAADILLLIEVADTTLDFDLGRKLRVYAEAGIPEYWVVSVAAGEVHIFRAPRDGRFTETAVRSRTETAECSSVPGLKIGLNEILG